LIANGQTKSRVIRSELNLSPSQLHTKIQSMSKAGLIEKNDGDLILTKLGKIVFQAQEQIEYAINRYWELKAIDSIEDGPSTNMEEAAEIMKGLDFEKQKKSFH
jgi:predicted transcriptional regulator